MRLRLVCFLLTAAIASAQPSAETKAAARELLDSAEKLVGGTQQPHIHVMALMDIGAVYHVFDKQKSISFLRNAFAVTTSVPEADGPFYRTRLQGDIVKRLADISISHACDLLRWMAEPGKD